jgi:hypothetical protein
MSSKHPDFCSISAVSQPCVVLAKISIVKGLKQYERLCIQVFKKIDSPEERTRRNDAGPEDQGMK